MTDIPGAYIPATVATWGHQQQPPGTRQHPGPENPGGTPTRAWERLPRRPASRPPPPAPDKDGLRPTRPSRDPASAGPVRPPGPMQLGAA